MQTFILISVVVLGVAVSFYAYRRLLEVRERRILRNEYKTAVTVWDFARTVKSHTDEMIRQRTSVLDFTKIMVPPGVGYKICLELTGRHFRVTAVPERHKKTGRLSFYADNTLIVRAWDHGGEPASESDPEYLGEETS